MSQGPKRLAPPPVPADVGLVAALSIEVNPLIQRLAKVRRYSTDRHSVVEGELDGKIVAVIFSGPGRTAAGKAARVLLAGHRPNWLISAGFGGALDPRLKRNDVVFATEVLDPEGQRFDLDLTMRDDPDARVFTGSLATVDAIVRTAAEKAAIHAESGAAVVDMETSAVAALCRERGVRLLSIRVISDEAGVDLPPEIASILGRSGGYRLGAAIGAIWSRPSSLMDMLALREHAMAAADRLAGLLPGVIARLP